MECLDGLVSIINDQDARTTGVMYLNDLPDMSFQDNVFKSSPIVYGDTTDGSAVVTNLSFNTSNMDAGEYVIGKPFPNCTTILSIDSATQITLDNNATETCCQVPLYIKSRGQKLVEDKIDFAKHQVLNDVLMNLQSCIKNNSVIDNDVIGYWDDYNSNTIQASTAKYKGLQVTIDRYPYLEFYVHKINLFFNTAITSNIIVYDLIENRVIDTIPFTSVANQITEVVVNESYNSDKQRVNLFFYYDAGLTGNYKTYINKKKTACKGCGKNSRYVELYGAEVLKTSSIIQDNIDREGECHGMSMTYSLNCTIEPFLCSIRNLLQFPLLYKSAAEIMKEAYYNPDRVNSYVTTSRGDHKELWQEYEAEYNKLMFGGYNEDGSRKLMQGLIDRLVLPRDICFDHRQGIRKITRVP